MRDVSYRIVDNTFKSVLFSQLFSFLAQIISMVVDGVITGKCLGSDNLAAYGFAGTVVCIVTAFAGFAMTGITIICARTMGNTDENERTSAFSTSMVASVILGVVVMAVTMIFSRIWSSLAGAEGEIIELSSQYLIGFGIGIIPFILVTSIFPIMQLDGDKKRMMVSFMIMSLTDIVLDLLNGYVLQWGIFGMGFATALSNFVALIILLFHFKNANHMFHFKISTFNAKYIADIFVYGYMYIVKQLLVTALTFVFNNYLMKKYNADMVAVYTAIVSAGSVCLCIGMAIGSTVSVMTSVYAGEKDGSSLKKLLQVSIKYSVVLNAIAMVVVGFCAKPLVGAYFNSNDDLMEVAVTAFRIYLLMMIIRSINLSIRGYYQSMKMQKLTFGFSFLHAFLNTVVFMFILDGLIGINGVWLSFLAGEFTALLILVIGLSILNRDKDGIEKIMFLPADFKTENASIMEGSFDTIEGIIGYSEEVRVFCKDNGVELKTANGIALAIEELAGNVIQYGFIDKRKHSIDIRVTKNEDDWFIRIRDDCDAFNPVMYMKENEDSSIEHIGIHMICKLAKDIQYVNTLNLNNLVITF